MLTIYRAACVGLLGAVLYVSLDIASTQPSEDALRWCSANVTENGTLSVVDVWKNVPHGRVPDLVHLDRDESFFSVDGRFVENDFMGRISISAMASVLPKRIIDVRIVNTQRQLRRVLVVIH